MATVIIKRVYDKPNDDDGARVLIDKLWPRGIRKDALLIDALVLKEYLEKLDQDND